MKRFRAKLNDGVNRYNFWLAVYSTFRPQGTINHSASGWIKCENGKVQSTLTRQKEGKEDERLISST